METHVFHIRKLFFSYFNDDPVCLSRVSARKYERD